MAFWRSISSEPISESDFIIRRKRDGEPIANNEELGWRIVDTLGMTKVTLDWEGHIGASHLYVPNYSKIIEYDAIWGSHKNFASRPILVRIFEREFFIDKYGTYIFPQKRFRYRGMVTAYGHWWDLRSGNDLPKDYVPNLEIVNGK